jgi:Clathrin light chain
MHLLSQLYREYQIKHEEYLREKAFKSQEKHQAILDKAKSDIDNFYKERALKRDKAEASNRYELLVGYGCLVV